MDDFVFHFCFITAPHSQVLIFIVHSSKWAKQSRLLTVSLHRRQDTSAWRHVVLTCALSMSRLNFSLQARHSPCWVATILLANMLLQNCTTTWRQWAQEIGPAVSLRRSTPDPQYVSAWNSYLCVQDGLRATKRRSTVPIIKRQLKLKTGPPFCAYAF